MTPSKQRMTEKWQNGMINNTEKKLYTEWQLKCKEWQIETYITRNNDDTKWMNTNMQGKRTKNDILNCVDEIYVGLNLTVSIIRNATLAEINKFLVINNHWKFVM